MIRVSLLVLGVVLVAYGALELVQAARTREPAQTSCAGMIEAPPPTRWVSAGGCEIDYMSATWRETRGQIHELYFPVQPSGQPVSAPIRIVAATTDPEALAIAQGTVGDGRRADQESFTVMGLRIVTILKASREIDGYARHGVLDRMLARRALAGFGSSLAPDFVVVDLHARPPIAMPALATTAGTAAFLGFAFTGRRRRRPGRPAEPATAAVEPEAEAPPIGGPEPSAVPVAAAAATTVAPPRTVERGPASVVAMPDRGGAAKLPAMMLLNLPASAGAQAIEHAPPLGTRAEVMNRIARALPGLHVGEDGRAAWAGHDWSLAVSLGAQDPVWTVTVEARGASAAELAHQLATRTGWRVYVPKRGSFMFDEQPVER